MLKKNRSACIGQWRISPHASEPVEKNALEFLNPNHGIKKIQGKRSGKMEKK